MPIIESNWICVEHGLEMPCPICEDRGNKNLQKKVLKLKAQRDRAIERFEAVFEVLFYTTGRLKTDPEGTQEIHDKHLKYIMDGDK
jgi:hypothetical protein